MSHRERKISKTGESLYASLGLQRTCTGEEVRRKYRQLALRTHPDKNPDDPEAAAKFREINHAYEILSDDEKREIYDTYGSFGVFILDQFGDNAKLYLRLTNPFTKALFIVIGILTLCYCCCFCCCFCFCSFCCGKCLPEEFTEDEEATPPDNMTDAAGGISSPVPHVSGPITQQPRPIARPIALGSPDVIVAVNDDSVDVNQNVNDGELNGDSAEEDSPFNRTEQCGKTESDPP